MADPIATYGAEVLAKDGFRMSGDQRSGMKVTVKYRLPWPNAYLFLNALMNPIYATRVGLITYTLPYRLPSAIAATPVYAQSFDIQPVGTSVDPYTTLPYKGMAAGEYYKYGIVTIGFEQVPFTWDATDDPQNQNQLDPAQPIALCEQSVKFSDKMQTIKGHRYLYVSDGKPVIGDFAVPTSSADITLRFPHVPYLPWQMLQPYLSKVNANTLFLCAPQTLLFKSPDITTKSSMIGGQAAMEQSVVLTFRYNPDGWNKLPKPDGTLDDVVKAGGGSIYQTADFQPLFALLTFSEAIVP